MSATGEDQAAGERGATLLEMLVVVALLTLTTGIVFPAFKRPYGTLQRHMAASALMADLRTARADATREGRPVTFDVALGGRLYGWNGQRRLLPASVRVATNAPIVFAADGSSSGGRLVVVGGDRRDALSVAPATGLVSVGAAP